MALSKKNFKISDVIDACCNHVFLDQRYKIHYEGNHNVEVYADQHKIDQVMINFVNNAVKYAPASKDITVTVEATDNRIKVSVTDYGRGIDLRDLPHVFERYYWANEEA